MKSLICDIYIYIYIYTHTHTHTHAHTHTGELIYKTNRPRDIEDKLEVTKVERREDK